MKKRPSSSVSRKNPNGEQEVSSLFERIGLEKVERLVAVFYGRVDTDPVIRPFYGKTLTCAIHGLTEFMKSWLGGPPTYEIHRARLRRLHTPFAIDARARDAWLSHMTAAVHEVGIPASEARVLLAHLEFGARALVNAGVQPPRSSCSEKDPAFDPQVAKRWNRLAAVEDLFDAVSNGDFTCLQSLLPKRLIPCAELLSHALAKSLDPIGRNDRRYGRRSKGVQPLEVVEFLLARREFDIDVLEGTDLERFRHLQAMIEAYVGLSPLILEESPLRASLLAATHDRFISELERDPTLARLVGTRGQTLLHEAAIAGEAEFVAALIHAGADPDARELEGHTPLYRASTGDAARVLLLAGATVDITSGPTQGTPLHQAARQGYESVVAVLLDHGASIEVRDSKGQTPLRRAVNCRKRDVAYLLVLRGANSTAADHQGVTPLDVARTDEMKRALAGA